LGSSQTFSALAVQSRESYCQVALGRAPSIASHEPPEGAEVAALSEPWLPVQPDIAVHASGDSVAHSLVQARSVYTFRLVFGPQT
jgi:hypothetical protein